MTTYRAIQYLVNSKESLFYYLMTLPLKGRVTLGRLNSELRKEILAHFQAFEQLRSQLEDEHVQKDAEGNQIKTDREVEVDGKKEIRTERPLIDVQAFQRDMNALLNTPVELKTKIQEMLFEGIDTFDTPHFDALEELGVLIPANYAANHISHN